MAAVYVVTLGGQSVALIRLKMLSAGRHCPAFPQADTAALNVNSFGDTPSFVICDGGRVRSETWWRKGESGSFMGTVFDRKPTSTSETRGFH